MHHHTFSLRRILSGAGLYEVVSLLMAFRHLAKHKNDPIFYKPVTSWTTESLQLKERYNIYLATFKTAPTTIKQKTFQRFFKKLLITVRSSSFAIFFFFIKFTAIP